MFLLLLCADIMDIVQDPISSGDYKKEEDPRLFRSAKTGRGPLEDGWRENYKGCKRGDKPVMTAYKLCRVEFKYWGMQNKIERFIHDVGESEAEFLSTRCKLCEQMVVQIFEASVQPADSHLLWLLAADGRDPLVYYLWEPYPRHVCVLCHFSSKTHVYLLSEEKHVHLYL